MIIVVSIVFMVIIIAAMIIFKERAKSLGGELEVNAKGKIIARYSIDLAIPKHLETITPKSAEVQPAENRAEQRQMHKAVDYHNLALNKPVVGLFLDVKKVKSIGKDILLQFDQSRLKNTALFHEQYSINMGTYPSNLTDGDHDTRAYPADFAFDYIVDLKGIYKLSEIKLDWGNFGTPLEKNNYITTWELYGQDTIPTTGFPSIEDWKLIEKGEIPGMRITQVSQRQLKNPVRRLRIRARSEKINNRDANWIGIYEIEAYGTLMK